MENTEEVEPEEVVSMAANFIKVKCKKCKNEQVIFEKPASEVKCLVCESVLVTPTGGKGRIETKVIGALK